MDGRRRRGQEKIGQLNGITDSTDMSLSKLQEMVKDTEACCSPWGHKELDTAEWLNNNKYTYKVEYYSAKKRNKVESFAVMWIDLSQAEEKNTVN